jgi:bifunctional polynucleotide phosphatase/kinase
MEWNKDNQENYLEGTTKNFEFTENIASFDLDGTLIKVKSGSKFPKDSNDWELFDKNEVISKLKELIKKKYCIIIISNQKGISTGKQDKLEWISKIEKIQSKLNLPLKVYASIKSDIYRKPFPTFFNKIKEELEKNKIKINYKTSFYCGDACGRKGDFSDTDYKFALNNKIMFYTPEFLFLENKESLNKLKIDYLDFEKIKENTKNIINPEFEKSKKPEIIIMIGCQGSGKSYYSQEILGKLDYYRINMDTLKTKAKCLKTCEAQMKTKKFIVIDNTNPDSKTRKEYIDLAKKYNYNITCIEVECPIEIAKHNTLYRAYKTGCSLIPDIAFNMFKKKYEKPDIKEGFTKIIKVNVQNVPTKNLDYFMYFS